MMAANGNDNWKPEKLEDVCTQITDGKHGDCRDQPSSGFYFLSCKDVANGKLNYEDARQITEDDFLDTHRRTKFAPSDVLITNSGTIGRMALAPDNELTSRTTFQKSVAILKPIPSLVEPSFLYYALQADIRRLIEFAGGTAQKNLLLRDLRAFEVSVPPLPVQRRISGILSAYDELMENSQRRIRILEAMARALYCEWFVHFRFPGHEKLPRVASPLGDIPQGWEVRTVKHVATVSYGFPFQSKKFNTDGIGTPVIRIRDIPEGFSPTFMDEDAEPKYHVNNGHILVGMDGDFHMCIWSSGHAFQNQRVARFESNGEIGNLHLFLALEKPIQELNKAIVGTTVAHLGDMHIRTIQIVWPPANVRAKAREVLEPMSEQIIALKRQIQNLRQTRDLLLPRLLSGQVNFKEN